MPMTSSSSSPSAAAETLDAIITEAAIEIQAFDTKYASSPLVVQYEQSLRPFLQRAFDLGASSSGAGLSEREKQLARREGFVEGAGWEYNRTGDWDLGNVMRVAANEYPILVERPRVVRDPHESVREWSVIGGVMQMRDTRVTSTFSRWQVTSTFSRWQMEPTPERVSMWADLYARPTESVSEESRT